MKDKKMSTRTSRLLIRYVKACLSNSSSNLFHCRFPHHVWYAGTLQIISSTTGGLVFLSFRKLKERWRGLFFPDDISGMYFTSKGGDDVECWWVLHTFTQKGSFYNIHLSMKIQTLSCIFPAKMLKEV